MHEKLKAFLDAKNENYEKKKQETLIKLGLFEKVYSPDNSYSEEYSDWELTDNSGPVYKEYKYYKKIPIEITDEEYQEVKKYIKREEDPPKNNPIAITLTVIAWLLFIGGFIAGIVFGIEEVEIKGYYLSYTETKFSFAITAAYWCASLIIGTMFLGFAEIIKLLEAIKNKKKK